MGDDLGEHVNSVKDGSNNDWDLLEDGVRSKKEGVLLGPLLNELLLLVELLKVLKINNININVGLGNLVLVDDLRFAEKNLKRKRLRNPDC